MAPEMVARGLGYDYSVDWWAVGMIVYEMLTRRLPRLTWYQRRQLQAKDHPETCLVNVEQSEKAREAIFSQESNYKHMSSHWHYESVDDLLMDYFPCPAMPTSGDVLNHIHIIEQRMAHEDVQHAHDLILKLLRVDPANRWPLGLADPVEILKHPWLVQPKTDQDGKLFPIEIDQRLGQWEQLQQLEQNDKYFEKEDCDHSKANDEMFANF